MLTIILEGGVETQSLKTTALMHRSSAMGSVFKYKYKEKARLYRKKAIQYGEQKERIKAGAKGRPGLPNRHACPSILLAFSFEDSCFCA